MLNFVENLLENERGPMNGQDLTKTDYDPDRSLVLSRVNFFEIFETGPAQICVDLLEIRIDKKNQMSMAVNQKYCQSCHLIS
jgi:hypothetical protein